MSPSPDTQVTVQDNRGGLQLSPDGLIQEHIACELHNHAGPHLAAGCSLNGPTRTPLCPQLDCLPPSRPLHTVYALTCRSVMIGFLRAARRDCSLLTLAQLGVEHAGRGVVLRLRL